MKSTVQFVALAVGMCGGVSLFITLIAAVYCGLDVFRRDRERFARVWSITTSIIVFGMFGVLVLWNLVALLLWAWGVSWHG